MVPRESGNEELAQQKRFLEKAQAIGVIGAWELDLEGNELLWTDETYRIFGLPIGTPLTYETFIECVHPDDREHVDRKWKAGLAGEPYDIKHRLIVDGKVKWVREKAELSYDENGRAIRGTGVIQDITEWVHTVDFLNQTGEISKVGGWWIEFDTMEVRWTRETGRIHEVSEDYVPSLDEAINFYEEEERPRVRETVRLALEEGRPFDEVWRFVTAKGNKKLVRSIGRPELKDGTTVRLGGTFQDITERQAIEDRLDQTQKLESLSTLAGGIAHDFNNILTGILGNVSLAMMELAPDSEVRTLLREAEIGLKHARGLSNQLLTFSRGGLFRASLIDPGELVREAVTFAVRGSRTRLELRIPDSLPAVEADADMLSQVLGNLVINASQAMPDGGTLTVAVERASGASNEMLGIGSGELLRISFSDRGVGIQPDHLSRIFDPYFSTKGTGRGLGLATCRSIIGRHGGVIEVASEVGRGTTLTIHLPALQVDASCALDKASEPIPVPARLKLMLVDDEPHVRTVFSRMMARLEGTVDEFASGEEAVAAFAKGSYDACVLDLTLPGGMGGVEIARRLREVDPEVLLLVSSGYSEDDAITNPAAYGFDGVLPKPYNLREVRQVLSNCDWKNSARSEKVPR